MGLMKIFYHYSQIMEILKKINYRNVTSVIFLMYFTFVCSQENCERLQWIEVGETGVVTCGFVDGYYSVYWYNYSNIVGKKPFIEVTPTGKGGPGYFSEQFDINNEGSLVIYKVNTRHEKPYTVVKFHSAEDEPVITTINVKTYVKPVPGYPCLRQCDNEEKFWFLRWDKTWDITCSIHHARPTVNLLWQIRKTNEYQLIMFDSLIVNDSVTHTTNISVTDPLVTSSALSFLVCKADVAIDILERNESLVFVYNTNKNLLTTQTETIMVKRDTMVTIPCTKANNNITLLVWEKILSENKYETLIVADLTYDVTKILSEGYLFKKRGLLVVPSLTVDHEGAYRCVHNNGTHEEVTVHNIKVYVNPVPEYPEVEGCSHNQYCSLKVKQNGSLSCKVSGIRPEVSLEWRGIDDVTSSKITFFNHQRKVESNQETSDILLTVEYKVHKIDDRRLTLECVAIGQFTDLFDLTTRIDLLITIDSENIPTDLPKIVGNSLTPIIVTVAVTIVIITIGAATSVLYRVSASKRKPLSDEEQNFLMTENKQKALKEMFIKELKESYDVMYRSIKPIPYLKNKMYSVHELYVQGGIEYLADGNRLNKPNWEVLETYQSILSDSRIRSKKRIIIQGEPGYGKSTLTLQFAYEWAQSVSFMKDVELLLIIKLRQMKGVISIYEAIKQFLLPRESKLGVDDIKDILSDCPSVVIILDGFDEYLDYKSDIQTDVVDILKRQMFQNIDVILTTRSSFLPKSFAPQTKHIRLTGFDKESQDKYLERAVTANKSKVKEKLNQWLEDNPVLGDLCQAPMFFALYVHAIQDNESLQKCTSVTVFFRYIVSCIMSHTINKSEDKNVERVKLMEDDSGGELTEIAYKHITGEKHLQDWSRQELNEKLGKQKMDEYIMVGILREEDTVRVSDNPGTSAADHIKYIKEIRFYHSLFCEWYAAHYIAERVASATENETVDILEDIEPSNFHYVYRFACGINPASAKNVINYLHGLEGGKEFAILCVLEQCGNVENIIGNIKSICSGDLQIACRNSRLLQRSVALLLDIASVKQITVSRLLLNDSYKSFDSRYGEIILKSNIRVQPLSSLENLWIDQPGCKLDEKEVTDVFEYSEKCNKLKTIAFSNSLLPEKYTNTKILTKLEQRKLEVLWYPSVVWYNLQMHSGRWENTVGNSLMTSSEYSKEVSNFSEANFF